MTKLEHVEDIIIEYKMHMSCTNSEDARAFAFRVPASPIYLKYPDALFYPNLKRDWKASFLTCYTVTCYNYVNRKLKVTIEPQFSICKAIGQRVPPKSIENYSGATPKHYASCFILISLRCRIQHMFIGNSLFLLLFQ